MAERVPASNRDWEEWGRRDPLWSVAAAPGKEAGGAAPWTDEEFYATGQAEWARHLARWERYGLDRDSCVEIGCGAGRLTRQLAQTFRAVHALDVSEAMLAYAKERVKDPAVTFQLVSGERIPLPDSSASAAFSTYVFQHFDSLAHGAQYFREVARVLRPRGSMLVQLPLHQWPWDRGALGLLHSAWSALDDAQAFLRRRFGLGMRPVMRGLSYPVPWLFDTLQAAGLVEVELISTRAPGARYAQQLVLAGKP